MQYMAQFAIIRMQKFQVSDVQGIQKHNQRQGISKSNPDIDYEKSHENYDFLNDQNLKYESEIKEIIAEQVKRKPRANSVVLSEFMVTASPEYMNSLSAEEQKIYFEKSLEFIQERYGQKNTLYAVVHQDEATPHMHVGVIPITEDNRLSAKDIFNKQELRELQEEFPKHLQENKFEVVRGEKGSEKKHLSSQEFKAKKDLEKEIDQLEDEKYLIEERIGDRKKELLAMNEDVPSGEDIKIKIMGKEIKTEVKQKFLGDAEVTKKETGNYVLSNQEIGKIKKQLVAGSVLKEKYENLVKSDVVELSDQLSGLVGDVTAENWKLKKSNSDLRNELGTANKKIISLEDRISDLRDEIGLVYQSTKEFLKERTDGLKAFKSAFKDLIDKVKERTTGSEFERLHKREMARERNKGLER